MKLYYFKHSEDIRNFGDDINAWLWEKFMPGIFDDNHDTIFMGIGTILNKKNQPKAKHTIVFGSGAGYGELPAIDKTWRIYCVRGPLSAQQIGLSPDLAITDPAVLVNKFIKALKASKKYRFSYMPHLLQARQGGNSWEKVCRFLGINYIDPQWPVEKVLSLIADTECLLSEALHGAIVADSLRVPWIPIKTNERIYSFKWHDWCSSMGIHYTPQCIMPLWNFEKNLGPISSLRHWVKIKTVVYQLSRILKKGQPILSKESDLKRAISKLESKCLEFKADREAGVYN